MSMLIKYRSSDRYSVSDNNKEALRKPNNNAVPYITYITRQGDTFDRMSHKLLNDFSRYWEIADLNPHVKFPDQLEPGTVIRIPR